LVRAQEDVFLDPGGCPICEYCSEAEDQFFRWFEIESFADPVMHAHLRRSVGLCARHERRALRIDQLAPMPSIVRGALDQLDAAPPERGECPACHSVRQAREHAETMLATVLASPALRARYVGREVGVCLPHLRATIASGPLEPARVLAEKLRGDLSEIDALEVVAGRDSDAPARAQLRTAVSAAPPAEAATSADVERAAWQQASCPICSTASRAERRYLEWRRHEERSDAIDLHQEPGVLCASHLHDLGALDAQAGARAASRARQRWLHELNATLRHWPSPPPRTRQLLPRPPAPPPRRFEVPFCPACEARLGAERRHLDLLLRLLAQRPNADAYERAHGACVRHASGTGDGPSATLVRHVLRARLREIGWEIAEAARKKGWDARHERPGPERTARVRLSGLLDGMTFLGTPARELP
jgi:hypothetical protein